MKYTKCWRDGRATWAGSSLILPKGGTGQAPPSVTACWHWGRALPPWLCAGWRESLSGCSVTAALAASYYSIPSRTSQVTSIVVCKPHIADCCYKLWSYIIHRPTFPGVGPCFFTAFHTCLESLVYYYMGLLEIHFKVSIWRRGTWRGGTATAA